MMKVAIKEKIARLEALDYLYSIANGSRESWMNCHDDGSKSAPLLEDDNDYQYAQYRAWDGLCELLRKEIMK